LPTIVLAEPVSGPLDFVSTAQAHGWVALRPFAWDPDQAELSRIHRLSDGGVVRLRMQSHRPAQDGGSIGVVIDSAEPLTPSHELEIRAAVRRILRLDENFAEFYQLCDQLAPWKLRLAPGGGRLLRCPTLFEDIVYTLCTTNINWSGTIRMVERLVTKLGDPFPGQESWRAFPSPAALAAAGPEFLKRETGLGYRSDYLGELASAVVEGRLDLTAFEAPEKPTELLHRELRQLKGVGNYAAATILMLLGRYEHLAIDSELRSFATKKYFPDQVPTEAQIRQVYAPWGRWQYLAYWFDTPA
jgi:3-methyladenine DNA glycosylase/8-oxoguanine DNA glycosylase